MIGSSGDSSVTLYQNLRRTLSPLKRVYELYPYVKNYVEVGADILRGQPVTRLAVRDGPVIHSRPEDPALFVFREIFVCSIYDSPEFYQPAKNHVVVDLGANIGIFALRCHHRAPGIRVFAVEPDHGTYVTLRDNVERNSLESTIHTYNIAVSDSDEPLYLDRPTTTSGERTFGHSKRGEPVRAMTLDQFFNDAGIEHCDLLKIDTEGAEIAIVEGASRDVWPKVDRLAIEYHNEDTKRTSFRLESYLKDLNYVCRVNRNPAYPHGMLYAWRS